MSKKEVIANLIRELQSVLTRPTMFILETTVNNVQIYLDGIETVCVAIGFDLGCRRQATHNQGWEYDPTGGVDPMREHGLTEEQIVHELLLIEIKILEIIAEGLED